ncbi:hypothetical protein ACYQOP_19350 [Methylobacterium sp. CM6247]
MTDDMMPMAEARERAAAMLEEQCNLVLRWAEGAVPEIAAEYGIDEAAASHIVARLAAQRLEEVRERNAVLIRDLIALSRQAPRLH